MISHDLPEEEVLALDGRGALVQGVNLGVADVLLDRIVLQVARATENLQGRRQQLIGSLGTDALDYRQQQVVEPFGEIVYCSRDGGRGDPVLNGGGVEDERPHAFRIRLLHHQHPPDVRVMDDRDAGRGLVRRPGQIGALDPGPRERQSVEVAGGQRRDGLGTHHHPGIFDDLEHLGDAVVDVPDKPADRRVLLAEPQFAGGGDLQAHLLLDAGDVDAVSLAGFAGRRIHQELRNQEHGQALGAGAVSLRPGKGEVEDVLRNVPVTRGDETLHALDMPGAVGLRHRPGAARPHVRTRVGFGEHHRRAPLPLDRLAGELLLCGIAEPVENPGEGRTAHVQERRRVGPQDQLRSGPDNRRRCAQTAQV